MEEPFLAVDLDGVEIRMTAYNSQLFTFMGRAVIEVGNERFEVERSAMDHVWLTVEKDIGLYFWAEHNPEQYQIMSSFILDNCFPAYLNSRSVASSDVTAWLQKVDIQVKTFADIIPDEI